MRMVKRGRKNHKLIYKEILLKQYSGFQGYYFKDVVIHRLKSVDY